MITLCHLLLVAAPRTLLGHTTLLPPSSESLAKDSIPPRVNDTNYFLSSTKPPGEVKFSKPYVLIDEEMTTLLPQLKEQFAHRRTSNHGKEAFDGLCDVQKNILESFSARGEKLLDAAIGNMKNNWARLLQKLASDGGGAWREAASLLRHSLTPAGLVTQTGGDIEAGYSYL
ncbi:hypothetical protein O3P69_017962 [Scylla paramamosain]|uniref:Uncharacterized protein n=1 Tax=Scylla paramamosain TaxID=85552 RepID=A0AAW0TJM1_SCYPA